MAYTIERADLLSGQLRRFTNGYAHHVAGQFSNIDFWLHEVHEAIKIIDGYNTRFNNMRDEQNRWLNLHGKTVVEYCSICEGKCEYGNISPPPVIRLASNDLKKSRKELVDSTYFFLLRCHRMKLIDKDNLTRKCEEIGVSIDPADLKTK